MLSDQSQRIVFDAASIANTVREPLLVLSADLRVLMSNAAFYRIFGAAPESTLGHNFFELANRQWEILPLKQMLEKVVSQGTAFEDFEVSLFAGAARKVMLLNARRFTPHDGLADLILLAIEDITERRWMRYFNLSHDLLCVATLDGYFVEFNPSFQRVLGYYNGDLLSKPFYEFVHPEDRSRTESAIKKLGTGLQLTDFRNRFRCTDGSYRWFDWTCAAPLSGDRFLYAAARDVTEIVQYEEERQHLTTELTRSNADLEQFAYVASHDLQEPLRAVAGCVQIIQKRYTAKLDAGADELIFHTVDGVKRMQALINDLLEYSRVSRKGNEFAPVDLNIVLTRALGNLEVSLSETGALVTHDPLPTVFADRGQMIRLLQNLLGNALKFHGSAKPTIHLGVERADNAWRISVRDNGIGIPSEYLERIFILFQRLHTRTEYPGTGMGLAICKKIVERHGGQISAQSEPAVGSTFQFTLPCDETGQ
jgi:PAS domain S-box-containing protein